LDWILNLESPKSESQPKDPLLKQLLLNPPLASKQNCSLRASVQYQNVAHSQDIAHVRVRMTFSYQIRTEIEHDVEELIISEYNINHQAEST